MTIIVAPALAFAIIPRRALGILFVIPERLLITGWIVFALILSWKLRTRARRAILWPLQEPHKGHELLARIGLGALILLVLVIGGGGIYPWSCPHGTSFRVGPFAVTHSTVGGPCNNGPYVRAQWRISESWYLWIAD